MEIQIFGFAFTVYFATLCLFFAYAITKREQLGRLSRWLLILAVTIHIVSLVLRAIHGRQMPDHSWYVPWSNRFESLSLFGLVIATEYLIIQWKKDIPIVGVFIMPVVFLMLFLAVNSPSGTQIPQVSSTLQSYWMAIHIPVMFISYALFANAFALGLAYLIGERQLKSKKISVISYRLPSLDELDHLIYKVIWVAFPLLTLGLLLGARWAYDAWGRYWGWDAKETWALITWLIYLGYLHMRLIVGWRGRKSAYLSLIGFAVVLFTYFGVSTFSKLHGFLSHGAH
ncbi:MAG: c-type cytochrome biogenesis protein CcsB [Elusimicrobiota bacterium]